MTETETERKEQEKHVVLKGVAADMVYHNPIAAPNYLCISIPIKDTGVYAYININLNSKEVMDALQQNKNIDIDLGKEYVWSYLIWPHQ